MRVPSCLALALVACHVLVAAEWVVVWEDDFNGPTVNASNWNILNNTAMGRPPSWNQVELYTADNVQTVTVDGRSALLLTTRPDNVTWDGVQYNITSGRVDTGYKMNVTFGRVEVNARLQNDAAARIHTAHWMLGYGCWPACGEIDIMECQSPHNEYLDAGGPTWQLATSNYHLGPDCKAEYPHTTGVSAYPHSQPTFNFTSDWTTFAVEWNKTDLVYFVNDTIVNHVWNDMPGWPHGNASVPTWPMFLIISQAFMAAAPAGNPPEWAWPVQQYIDYVRVLEQK